MRNIFITTFMVLSLMLTLHAQPDNPSSPAIPTQKPDTVNSPINVQQVNTTSESDNMHFAFSGLLLASLQNWADLQTTESKLGFGICGDLFAGVDMGDMYVGIGPHFGYNAWSVSKTADNVTATASTNVSDYGFDLGASWEGFYMVLGLGSSKVSVSADVGGTSQTVDMPTSISYRRVGLGWSETFVFGIAFTNYSKTEVPNNLNRLEFSIGVGF
jgi:hypothetical protein